MLVAVVPYKGDGSYKDNKILIADMRSGIVRYYTVEELAKLDEEIYQLFHVDDLYGASIQSFENGMLFNINDTFRLEDYAGYSDKSYMIYGVVVRIQYERWSTDFKINGNSISCTAHVADLFLAYAFKYRDFIVLRLRFTSADTEFPYWWTVLLDYKGEIQGYWSDDLSVCTNKSLATRIDITSEY